MMVHGFKLGYFSNLANMFHRSSCILTDLGRRALRDHTSDFHSDFGHVKGLMAPHEGGKIWNRWFPTADKEGFHYVTEGYLNPEARSEIRRVLAGLERIFGAPFINKNVKNSVRIRALGEIFPDAIFLHVKRDPFQAVSSILAARRKNCRSMNDWWSVMPKEVGLIRNRHYLEQVCGQFYYIEKDIEEDIHRIGKDQRLVLHYEDICQSPKSAMESIHSFLQAKGISLMRKRSVPDSFPRSTEGIGLESFEREGLNRVLSQLYGER